MVALIQLLDQHGANHAIKIVARGMVAARLNIPIHSNT
jgi:hypothetical protein